jgi:sugar (pentulose or hexulose) kinase
MNTYLGIEFGSTRIKAVTINEKYLPVSSGSYTWRSDYKDCIFIIAHRFEKVSIAV